MSDSVCIWRNTVVPKQKRTFFLPLYFYVYFLWSDRANAVCCVMEVLIQRTVNKYRWEIQKPRSGREEKGLVVNSREWLSLKIQAVGSREVGSFLPILCHFLLLYWQATDLDWPAFENTWWHWLRSMFDMRIKIKYWPPTSVSCDFHAPKCYLMLLIRKHRDIFVIQKFLLWHAKLVKNEIKLR